MLKLYICVNANNLLQCLLPVHICFPLGVAKSNMVLLYFVTSDKSVFFLIWILVFLCFVRFYPLFFPAMIMSLNMKRCVVFFKCFSFRNVYFSGFFLCNLTFTPHLYLIMFQEIKALSFIGYTSHSHTISFTTTISNEYYADQQWYFKIIWLDTKIKQDYFYIISSCLQCVSFGVQRCYFENPSCFRSFRCRSFEKKLSY